MVALIEVCIEPRRRQDRAALHAAAQALASHDQSLTVSLDAESGQTILSGVSEQQLEHALEVLRGGFEIDFGSLQVAYRETLTQPALIDHTFTRPIGPKGDFARVILQFEPLEPGAGYQFQSNIVAGSPLMEYVSGVETGLLSAKEGGLLAGFPVVDFKATLVDGVWHDIDSSVMAFETAARAAFRELRIKGAPVLLEPVMWVEILAPQRCVADVIGDLNSRRGQIQRAEQKGDAQLLVALAPLSNLFGYPLNLDLITRGAGRCEMRYDHHDPMPIIEPPEGTFPPAVGMRA